MTVIRPELVEWPDFSDREQWSIVRCSVKGNVWTYSMRRKRDNASAKPPIVFLPLMRKPAKETEKGIKYLPEVWRPNDR